MAALGSRSNVPVNVTLLGETGAEMNGGHSMPCGGEVLSCTCAGEEKDCLVELVVLEWTAFADVDVHVVPRGSAVLEVGGMRD